MNSIDGGAINSWLTVSNQNLKSLSSHFKIGFFSHVLELKDLKFGTDIKSTNLKRSNGSDFRIRPLFYENCFSADDVIQSNWQNAKKKKTFQLAHC